MNPNPLRELVKQLGVGIQDVASLADIDPDTVTQLLSVSPVETDAFLRVMSALGIRLRVAPAHPLALWFDLPFLDNLYFDPAFRQRQNLLPVPRTKGELRDLVVRLGDEHGPTKTCKLLEESLIATALGVREWNRGSVPQYQRTSADFPSRDEPLERPAWVAKEWRQWVQDRIVDSFCRYDPVAFVRYGFRWDVKDGLLIASNKDRMPAKPREWIIQSLGEVEWLAGHLGIVD